MYGNGLINTYKYIKTSLHTYEYVIQLIYQMKEVEIESFRNEAVAKKGWLQKDTRRRKSRRMEKSDNGKNIPSIETQRPGTGNRN